MGFLIVSAAVGALLGLVFLRMASKAQESERRSRALSKYAARFGLVDARCLNDLALLGILDSVNRKWGRAWLTGKDHFYMSLESFVAIRDRVDSLEGRASGHYNKSHIRNAVTVATLGLNERVSYSDQRDMIEPLRNWDGIPDEHIGYFTFHLGVMEHVYMTPNEDFSEVEYRNS